MRTWVDTWIPAEVRVRGPEARRRARLVVVISLLAAPAGGFLALVLLLLGANALSAGFSAGTVLLLVAPFVLRDSGSVDSAGLWACLNLLWPMAFLAASGQGGAAAPGGFALVALLSALLVPRTLSYALATLTVSACVIAGLYAGPRDPLLAIVAVTTTLAVFGVAMVYRATADDALYRYQAALTKYRAEVDKHRRTRTTLEDVHRELLEQAAIAGRAEIATGILHNVGNTVGWVTLAAEEMEESLEESRVGRLRRAAALLELHKDDLPFWAAQDPNALEVVERVAEASLHVAAEREELLRDVKKLLQGLDHIRATVKMQQAYSRSGLVEEVIAVEQLVNEAIRYSDATVRIEGLQIQVSADDMPLVMIDKHRLMQILVNLVGNAKQAVRDGATDGPRVLIRVQLAGTARLRIEVRDNGIGISRDDLARVFRHGFTTKRDGHGFGLHACQVSAKQMGGELTCHSDGLGQGAAFHLDLPLKTVRRQPSESEEATEVASRPHRDANASKPASA